MEGVDTASRCIRRQIFANSEFRNLHQGGINRIRRDIAAMEKRIEAKVEYINDFVDQVQVNLKTEESVEE